MDTSATKGNYVQNIVPIIFGLQRALYRFGHTCPTVIVNKKFAIAILLTKHGTHQSSHN
jgi:hypothetical protein